jgi:hypothetical protein
MQEELALTWGGGGNQPSTDCLVQTSQIRWQVLYVWLCVSVWCVCVSEWVSVCVCVCGCVCANEYYIYICIFVCMYAYDMYVLCYTLPSSQRPEGVEILAIAAASFTVVMCVVCVSFVAHPPRRHNAVGRLQFALHFFWKKVDRMDSLFQRDNGDRGKWKERRESSWEAPVPDNIYNIYIYTYI